MACVNILNVIGSSRSLWHSTVSWCAETTIWAMEKPVGKRESTDTLVKRMGGLYVHLCILHTMNLLARKRYPGLPLILLLGHSMGSFFARWFAAEYPDGMDALIISGTGGPNPLVNVGIHLSDWISSVKGKQVSLHRNWLTNWLSEPI